MGPVSEGIIERGWSSMCFDGFALQGARWASIDMHVQSSESHMTKVWETSPLSRESDKHSVGATTRAHI